jgi:hypothetical protein
MLTIKNTNKIVNHAITAEWYVDDIKEMNSYNPQTNKIQTLYLIIIRNRITKYFEEINLYRVKGIDNRWYELSCIRKGNKHTEFLSLKGIENIKVLLHHIKIVGID